MKIQNLGKFSTLIKKPQNIDVTVESNPMATDEKKNRKKKCKQEHLRGMERCNLITQFNF